MRYIELHDDNNIVYLVNLDNVTHIHENDLYYIDGYSTKHTESLEQIKEYIRCINELESKYTQYFNTHKGNI